MEKINEQLEQKVKERIKSTLEIPAQYATKNKQIDIKERELIMLMIEDILNYLDDWQENSIVLEKYHQHCFDKQFQGGQER